MTQMMTSVPTLRLRRISAGNYETPGREFTIVLNPCGWVAYRTDDPSAADRYDTLSEARQVLSLMLAGTTCRSCAERIDVDSAGDWYHYWTGSVECVEGRNLYAAPIVEG